MQKILVVGIGNVGRADDGLGWAFLEQLESNDCFELQYRYQLQVEDSELISHYEKVWFVDASHAKYSEGYHHEVLKAERLLSYTSHALPPSAVLSLCHDIYGKYPEAHLLGISGDEWGLRNGMSHVATERLESALNFFYKTLNDQLAAEIFQESIF